MTFRTTLFRALAAADVALCNGSPVRAKLIEYDTGIDPFVSLADGTSLAINDDEIAIDEAGRAYTQHPDESGAVVWTFKALQPLTAACVQPMPAEPPRRITDVLSRARQLDALTRRQD